MDNRQTIKFKGWLKTELIRNGKVIGVWEGPNGVTNEGKDHALDVVFGGATQITTWYMGLISSAGYSALAAADTMASHAGWTEFTNYSEGTRPEWTDGAASGQAKTNAAYMVYTITASGTIKGGFLSSSSTKGGTAGKLWATALYGAGDLAVVNGDVIRNTYTITAT